MHLTDLKEELIHPLLVYAAKRAAQLIVELRWRKRSLKEYIDVYPHKINRKRSTTQV